MYDNGETGRCVVCRSVMTVEEQKRAEHSIHVCSESCEKEYEEVM